MYFKCIPVSLNLFKKIKKIQPMLFQMTKIDHINLIDLYAETSPDFLIISCKEMLTENDDDFFSRELYIQNYTVKVKQTHFIDFTGVKAIHCKLISTNAVAVEVNGRPSSRYMANAKNSSTQGKDLRQLISCIISFNSRCTQLVTL